MDASSLPADAEPLPIVEPDLLMATFTPDGMPTFRNEAWVRVLGNSNDVWSDLSDEDIARTRKFTTDAAAGLLVTNEFFLLSPSDEDPLPLLLSFLPVHVAENGTAEVKAVVVSGEVLREPDTWMQNQTQRNRVETLGRMTMGIAHDFNNLLSGILGYTELLKQSADEGEPIGTQREYLRTIERAALDGASLIRKIQQYIRNEQQKQFEPLDVETLIRECVSLSRPYWYNEPRRQGISIDIDLELATVPPILGSGTELREVFLNLILNAVQAMPDGGKLRIASQDEGNGLIRVTVEDSGGGMPEHVRRRIFEPLFTTKGERGTGMGLSVSYGIIREHDGRIEVESAPGEGTRFNISLPASAEDAAVKSRKEPESAVQPARVLVVDDEPMVRSLLVKLLGRRGHDVVDASSGPQALELISGGTDFDIIFTDHGMPDMNGRQFAKALRALPFTDLVVLLTGDTEVGDSDDIIDLVLGKPFKLQQLDKAIRDLVVRADG